MMCECMNATIKSDLWNDFVELRSQCPALKEVLIPDDIWKEFQTIDSKERDRAFHRSIILLAFERGHLNKITSPIHRYLINVSRLNALVNKNYKNDLKELWMSADKEEDRHRRARSYMGKLVELQCAEWLEQQGWKISNLEALGGEYDIEASSPDDIKYAIEVKYIGQDDDSFSSIVKQCAFTLQPYTACDYLLFRVYEASCKLKASTKNRIAVIVISFET